MYDNEYCVNRKARIARYEKIYRALNRESTAKRKAEYFQKNKDRIKMVRYLRAENMTKLNQALDRSTNG